MRVEVDVCAVLLRLLLQLHVQHLDYVGNEVRQNLVELDLLRVLLDPLLLGLLLVVEAADLVLDDLDLVLEHARALYDLVCVRAGDLLAKVVLGIAENVDVHRCVRRRQRGWRRGWRRSGRSGGRVRHVETRGEHDARASSKLGPEAVGTKKARAISSASTWLSTRREPGSPHSL